MTKPPLWPLALCCAASFLVGCGEDANTKPIDTDPLIGSPTGTFKTNLGGWHVVAGTWSETAAGEQGIGTSASDGWLMSTDVGADFSYEADLTITKGNAAQLIFRSQTQTPSAGAYVATISKNNNFVRLYKYPGGATLGTPFPLTVALDKTYHMKVVALGSNIRVYIDGVNDNGALIDVTDTSPLASGAFGLAAATATATFQNVNQGAATKSPFNTNLAGWAAVQGTWATTTLGVQGTSTSGDAWYMSTTSAGDFAYEADLTLNTPTGNAAQLVFRSQAANPSTKGAYIATLSKNNNWVKLLKYTGTGIVTVGNAVKFSDLSPAAPAVTNNTIYHMKVLAVGSNIKIYIRGLNNDAPLIDVTDTSFTSGFLGLAASTSTATFQNVYKNQFNTNISGWAAAAGTWSGTPFGQQGVSTSTADAWYLATDTGSDFVFESDVKIDSGNAAQLVFRAQSNKDLFKGAYVITLSKTNNWVKLLKYPGAGAGVTGVGDPYRFPAGAPVAIATVYHVKVVAVGSSIKVYVRGVNSDNALFERTDSTFKSGSFGVAVSGGTATFQNAIQCATANYYIDADHDGFGAAGSAASAACSAPTGTVSNASDCNDASALVNPSATESCNAIDDNCNGLTDEGVGTAYYVDGDGDGYGAAGSTARKACTPLQGYAANDDDCNDADRAIRPNSVETCNGVDDNCNALTDEPLTTTYFPDADGDFFGDPAGAIEACSQPAGYTEMAGDCDDHNAKVHPGATEKCDGVDEDCDGATDPWLTSTTYHRDADGDGYGDPAGAVQEVCFVPEGFVADATDCNDQDRDVHPGARETCNTRDDNCNGETDEGEKVYLMEDLDHDGYGDLNGPNTQIGCTPPEGFTTLEGDCDDSDPDVHPTAAETCNGKDDDCNHWIDDGGVCDAPATCPANDRYEPNATLGAAAPIPIAAGTTKLYQGVSCSAGGIVDDDWYALELLAGDVLSIANPDAAHLALELFASPDTVLASATAESPLSYVASANVTLYLLVHSVGATDAPYTLDLTLSRCGGCDGFTYCETSACLPGCGLETPCGELERCDLTTHTCVTSDCRNVQCDGHCDVATGVCSPGCDYSEQCADGETCDTDAHVCAETPAVAADFPGAGATLVAIDSEVSLVFRDAMDRVTTGAAFRLAANGVGVAGTFLWSSDARRLMFQPAAVLARCTTYTGTLAGSAKVAEGTALGTAFTWTFTTACGVLSFEERTLASDDLAAIMEAVSAPTLEVYRQQVMSTALANLGEYFAAGEMRDDGEVVLTYVDGHLHGMEIDLADQTAPAPEPATTIPTAAVPSAPPGPTTNATAQSSLPSSKRAVMLVSDYGDESYDMRKHINDSVAPWLRSVGYDEPEVLTATLAHIMALRDGGPIGVLLLEGHGSTGEGTESRAWRFRTISPVAGSSDEIKAFEKRGYLYRSNHGTAILENGQIHTPPGNVQKRWGIEAGFARDYIANSAVLARDGFVTGVSCGGTGLKNLVKDAGTNTTVAVSIGGGGYKPPLTLFNWMLGVNVYDEQRIKAPQFSVRPFDAERVYAAMKSFIVEKDGHALNWTDYEASFYEVFGNGMLAPSIREVRIVATDPAHVHAIAYGQFGTTNISDVTATLGGVSKPVVVSETQVACLVGATGDCAEVAVDLGSAPCGELQISVRGIKSNVVPLTCWSGSVSLTSDINPYGCEEEVSVETDDIGVVTGVQTTTVSTDPVWLTVDCDVTYVADARAYRANSPTDPLTAVSARPLAYVPGTGGCRYAADGVASKTITSNATYWYSTGGVYSYVVAESSEDYHYTGSGKLPDARIALEMDLPGDTSDGIVRAAFDAPVVPLAWTYHYTYHLTTSHPLDATLDSDETTVSDDAGTLPAPLNAYGIDAVTLPNDPDQPTYLSIDLPIGIYGGNCRSGSTQLSLQPSHVPEFATRR